MFAIKKSTSTIVTTLQLWRKCCFTLGSRQGITVVSLETSTVIVGGEWRCFSIGDHIGCVSIHSNPESYTNAVPILHTATKARLHPSIRTWPKSVNPDLHRFGIWAGADLCGFIKVWRLHLYTPWKLIPFCSHLRSGVKKSYSCCIQALWLDPTPQKWRYFIPCH